MAVVDIPYQRVQAQNELKGSLLNKYRMAKALTMISLFAIVLMAVVSLFYPNYTFYDSAAEERQEVDDIPVSHSNQDDSRCYLPSSINIPTSPDGSYTPPPIHASLVRAVGFASNDEFQSFCQKYDRDLDTFTDEWPYNADGECGTWQQHYTNLHKHNMEMVAKYKAGEFPKDIDIDERPRFISYICKEVPKDSNRGCGGLADRMGGMISTFFYGLLTNRAYLLNWAPMNPLPIETVWERPHVDWVHDPAEMETLFTDEENPLLGYQKVDTLNKKHKVMTSIMFPDGGNTDFNDLWNGTYVEVRSNRGYIVRTFQLSEKYRKQLNAMGLTKENTFRCITNYLFRPTIGARRFLNAYKSLFAMESVLSIGIQVRTDDHALLNPHGDQNGLELWGHFLKCAGELASFKRQPHHKHIVFFLVTDSGHLRDEFLSLNHDKQRARQYLSEDIVDISSMVVTGLPIEHIEPEQIAKYIEDEEFREINVARMLPGVNSAYMENWLLGETQYRVISVQGYGKMASFYSGDDRTSISMPKPRKDRDFPVCNTEEAFTTFDWLSTQWSLG